MEICWYTCFQTFSHKYQDLLPPWVNKKVDQTTDRKLVILSHQPTTYQLQYPVIMVPLFAANMHIFWVALHGKNIEASTRASTGTNLSHGKNQVLRENQCRDSIAGRVELSDGMEFNWLVDLS